MVLKLLNKIKPIISHFIYSIPKKICYFLEFQLFITILALPIFLSWGLPISILSPIGNLIFTPWLTAFLTLSSFIFFTQLICMKNSFMIYALEKLNQLFFYILDLADQSFMISCPYPGITFLLLIPISLFFIIGLRKSPNIYIRVLKLFIFSSLLFFSLKYFLASEKIFEHITNKNKQILVMRHNSKNVFLDKGALGEGRSAQNWVKYQLIPKLLKLGIDHLDYLIIPYASSKTFESIIEIFQNMTVKSLYLQKWEGLVPYTGWKCWKSILDLKKKKKQFITLFDKPLKIKINKDFIINVKPDDNFINKGPLKYKNLKIEADLNQERVNLLSFTGSE